MSKRTLLYYIWQDPQPWRDRLGDVSYTTKQNTLLDSVIFFDAFDDTISEFISKVDEYNAQNQGNGYVFTYVAEYETEVEAADEEEAIAEAFDLDGTTGDFNVVEERASAEEVDEDTYKVRLEAIATSQVRAVDEDHAHKRVDEPNPGKFYNVQIEGVDEMQDESDNPVWDSPDPTYFRELLLRVPHTDFNQSDLKRDYEEEIARDRPILTFRYRYKCDACGFLTPDGKEIEDHMKEMNDEGDKGHRVSRVHVDDLDDVEDPMPALRPDGSPLVEEEEEETQADEEVEADEEVDTDETEAEESDESDGVDEEDWRGKVSLVEDRLEDKTRDELREMAREEDLKISGTKEELKGRIAEAKAKELVGS